MTAQNRSTRKEQACQVGGKLQSVRAPPPLLELPVLLIKDTVYRLSRHCWGTDLTHRSDVILAKLE